MTKHRQYFVSYRRIPDGMIAEQIAAVFAERFGADEVFFDRNPASLPAGVSWPHELISNVAACRTMVPIIGPGWFAELESRNRDPNGGWLPDTSAVDWVRREIGFALQFGKRVMPILTLGATLPDQRDLPPDLQALCERQVFAVREPHDLNSVLAPLFEQLLIHRELPPPVPLGPLTILSANQQAPDADPSAGSIWDPQIETDSPHVFDYKVCVLDPEVRHRIRVELLAANHAGELRRGFTLSELRQWVVPRKFTMSSEKKGMFVQASCIVSDGMTDGQVSQVLMLIRNSYQFHDPTKTDPRNVEGESCLAGTCLSVFDLHQGKGHLAKAVLNDLVESNPWAVFSRKLLIPDSVIDCRFAGVGFNLTNPDKEYIHLIWHVRTRSCPEIMLVPARQEKDHDVPIWQSMDQVTQYNFEKAPIDRHVVESVFNVKVAIPEKPPKAPWLTGFLRFPGFDNTQSNGFRPVRWQRDTVPLDLARMFQQYLHKDRLQLSSTSALGILSSFNTFVDSLSRTHRIPVILKQITCKHLAAPFDHALMLTVIDEAGRQIGRYLVLAAEWIESQLTDTIVSQLRERALIGFSDDQDPTGVIFLQGVHRSERSQIQGALSLHHRGEIPIHVVRLALGPQGIEMKRVAHAVIPIRKTRELPEAILVTLSSGDERPRLPGGKIEGAESPAQAVVRELNEELGLESHEIQVKECIQPEGINVIEISPSSGRLTHYRMFTFVVRIVGTGVSKTLRLLQKPAPDDPSVVWPVSIEDWRADGLGFDNSYAQAVTDMLTMEQLMDAALDLTE